MGSMEHHSSTMDPSWLRKNQPADLTAEGRIIRSYRSAFERNLCHRSWKARWGHPSTGRSWGAVAELVVGDLGGR